MQCLLKVQHLILIPWQPQPMTCETHWRQHCDCRRRVGLVIEVRDRSKNRRSMQKGRYLSSEAIQAVQSLKRSKSKGQSTSTATEGREKALLQRLIKKDMVAVMQEFLSQDEPLLALLVFEKIRKEHWYRPQLVMYLDIISVLARLNLQKELKQTCSCLKREYDLQADTETFNLLFGALLEFSFVHLAMDCYRLMKLWECEPDQDTYRVLIHGLESRGKMDISQSLRLEAKKQFGASLDFLEEKEDNVEPSHAKTSGL